MTWKERRDAYRSQIKTGDGRAAVLACLQDSNRRVRQEGIRNVGPFLDDREVIEVLLDRLNDRSLVVRRELVPLTPQLGLRAAPTLMELSRTAVGENLKLSAEALASLSEAHPDPTLRGGAAMLRKRAKGWFLSPTLRSSLQRCASRIDTATDHAKDLPRAVINQTGTEGLPIPGFAPSLDREKPANSRTDSRRVLRNRLVLPNQGVLRAKRMKRYCAIALFFEP